jgi:hypothetical protein
MLLMIIAQLLKQRPKVTDDFKRMMLAEYRSVPIEYAEFFTEKNKRLPTLEELNHAI